MRSGALGRAALLGSSCHRYNPADTGNAHCRNFPAHSHCLARSRQAQRNSLALGRNNVSPRRPLRSGIQDRYDHKIPDFRSFEDTLGRLARQRVGNDHCLDAHSRYRARSGRREQPGDDIVPHRGGRTHLLCTAGYPDMGRLPLGHRAPRSCTDSLLHMVLSHHSESARYRTPLRSPREVHSPPQ